MTDAAPQPQPTASFRLDKILWVWRRSILRDLKLLGPVFIMLVGINLAIDTIAPELGMFSFLLIYMLAASTLTYMALTPFGETLEEAIGIGIRAWRTVAIVTIGVCLILLIFTQFFVIPALLVLPLLALSVPVIMAERPSLVDLGKRCAELVKDVFLPAVLMLLSVLVVHFVVIFVLLVIAELMGIRLDRVWSVIEVAVIISLIYFAAALYIVRTVRDDLYYQALRPSNS